jgi:hypothetical protein
MLSSILTDTFSIDTFLICMVASLVLGAVIAKVHCLYNYSSKGFIITIALLPAIVQMVIMLVNGNLGTGVAVMGAFSLVRFRSIPGNAKEINSIFMAMAIGLATGTGYVAAAVMFVLIVGGVSILYNVTSFGESKQKEKELKITIPEGLDYTGVFDDLFKEYTTKNELINVKTANMGSLYKLDYRISLKNPVEEKVFLDALRCRNGNLEIACGKVAYGSYEL